METVDPMVVALDTDESGLSRDLWSDDGRGCEVYQCKLSRLGRARREPAFCLEPRELAGVFEALLVVAEHEFD